MAAGRTLGVGVLGFGFMGRMHTFAHRVIPFYYDPPPVTCRLVAVCRATAERLDAARQTGGFERAVTDPMEVINAPDVDIVHICTPNSAHMTALRAAIAAGKHIYVDKPVTANLAEAEELLGLLPAYRGKAQVALQYRCFPATMKAKQLVEEGFLGPVTHFHAAYLHSSNVDPDRPASWKTSAQAGGGVIRDLGVHILDMLNWLIGPFDAVQCVSRIWAKERPGGRGDGQMTQVDAEDAASLLLRAADGTFGSVDISKLATGTEDELRFEIHGRNGAMRFNLMQPNFLEVYDGRLREGDLGGGRGWQQIASVQRYPPPGNRFPSPKNTLGWVRGHVHSIYNFLKCIADDTEPRPSLEEGIAAQRMVEAARVSAERQTWVSIGSAI